MSNSLQEEVNQLTNKIQTFWGDNVENIQLTEFTEEPFIMFTLVMKLYGNYDVMMEYERSTLGISVKNQGQYMILSKLSDTPIFRGLKSYIPENLLHNFKALDKVLKNL